jgi:(R,R)-butanediol dehydrogenase / meso-butanediol dehydrogenase / diacetyl reductase
LKAARLKAPKEIVLEEIPVPVISDTEVLVRVKYCGVCGTDRRGFEAPGLIPLGAYIGHEFSGVISKVGKNVPGWKAGDRVVVNPNCFCGKCYACRHGYLECCEHLIENSLGCLTDKSLPGAFSEFVRVPFAEQRLYALPDQLSFAVGALVEPLASSLHAVRMSSFKPRDSAVVLGCGGIGLGVIAFLRDSGAGLIVATEVNEKRTEVAKKLGANFVFNPVKADLREEVLKLTGGLGVTHVFDCSGVPQAFQSASGLLRPRGQIVLVGIIDKGVPIVPLNLQINELQLQTSFCYSDEFPLVIDFLMNTKLPMREMLTSKIKLDDIQEGFNRFLQPGNSEIKLIVYPEDPSGEDSTGKACF